MLINCLEEPIATATWLIAVTSIRPEEIAFKWKDLNAEKRELKIVRAVNQGELHTPKYHRMNRPIRLTEADVERLLALKERVNGQEEDWMFPNRIKNGSIMKSGPIWHETLLARRIQPVARELGLPHITWQLQTLGSDTDGSQKDHLDHYGIDLPKSAAPLMKYAERIFSRPAYIEALTPSEKVMRR